MMARTHVLMGLGACTALAAMAPHSLPLCGATLAASFLGCLAPDLDHPSSWIGRRLWFVSLPLSALFGHRGLTHSLLATIGATALLAWYTVSVRLTPWLVAFFVGYLSHLVGDWLSSSGVPLLWPIKRKFQAPLTVPTGGAGEWGLRCLFAAYLLFWFGTRGVPPLI